MARPFYTPIDLNKNEIQNAVIQNLASAPSSPVKGQIYLDTVTNIAYFWNGTAWIAMGAGAGGAVDSVNGETGAVTLIASEIPFTPTGTIAASDVQAAIAEVASEAANPAFGSVTAETTFGTSSGNGAASTVARSDHSHGNPTHDAAAHSAIPLSALAVPTADVSLNSRKITGLADGTTSGDGVNLGQVQGLIATGTNKTAVRAATTANGTLATAYENGDAIDGVTLATGDRILLKSQTTGSENGIYTVNASGAPTRATDADISAEVKAGLSVWVNEGTVNADTRWVLTTNDPITVGTTALVFTQDWAASSTTAGAGLTATGQVIAVGAGTGITVNANDVAINPAVVMTRFGADVGDGTNVNYTINHAKGTRDVTVQVFRSTTPWEQVEVDVEHTDTNNVTLRFATAPTTAQFRCVVIG